jgi:hypothetical protein
MVEEVGNPRFSGSLSHFVPIEPEFLVSLLHPLSFSAFSTIEIPLCA